MAEFIILPGTGIMVLSDGITNLNGNVVTEIMAQRMKVGWGSDSNFLDVNGSNALPVQLYMQNSQIGPSFRVPIDMYPNGAILSAASNPLPVAGQAVEARAEFTRPANTTAYTASDAVSNSASAPAALTFPNLTRGNTKSAYIVKASIATDLKTCTARFRLHLFNGASAPTAINDNDAQTLLYANRASYVGSIDFAGMTTEDATNSTGAFAFNLNPRLPFVTSGSTSLYGLLEALDAFTPASGQNFSVALTVEQN
jgi:hypothetical protein